jgi:hypothetical protein
MIYVCIKFLQEWASPLTIVNYILLGSASGFTLATGFAFFTAPDLVAIYGVTAIVLTFAALTSRSASLYRNARIKPKSTLQTATGIRHPRIVQKAQGAMGGSFNAVAGHGFCCPIRRTDCRALVLFRAGQSSSESVLPADFLNGQALRVKNRQDRGRCHQRSVYRPY